jgi:high-affinity Fe2+/Pb2+ permease
MTTLALIALVLWLLVALVVLFFFFSPGTGHPARRALRWLRRKLWRRR